MNRNATAAQPMVPLLLRVPPLRNDLGQAGARQRVSSTEVRYSEPSRDRRIVQMIRLTGSGKTVLDPVFPIPGWAPAPIFVRMHNFRAKPRLSAASLQHI